MVDFFDKFVAGVNKSVKNIKNNSDLFVEKAELKSRIADTKKNKNNIIMGLGSFVYNLYSSDESVDERFLNMLKEIDMCNEREKELNKKIEALGNSNKNEGFNDENTVFCKMCGEKNVAGVKFCSYCGASMIDEKEK